MNRFRLTTIACALIWGPAVPAGAAEGSGAQGFLFYFGLVIVVLALMVLLAWLGNLRLRQLVTKKSEELKETEEEYRTLIGDLNISLFRVAGGP